MAKKYLDEEGLLYFWQKIKGMFSGKVDKVDGKGLSTNDYTTAEKSKLQGIEEGATKVIVDASLNSTSQNAIQNRAVNEALSKKVDKADGKGLSSNDYTTAEKEKLESLQNYTLPAATETTLGGIKVGAGLSITSGILSATGGGTADAVEWENVIGKPTNVSAFTNDVQYQTASQVTSAINNAVADITGMEFVIVDSLPATGEKGIIYLVNNSGSNPNSYDEYIYINDKFEKIGTTDVDLSGYVEESDLVTITNVEIDNIVES